MNATKLDVFTLSYIETALWSSTDDNGEPLDAVYGIDDIDDASLQQMIDDCLLFQAEQCDHISNEWEQAGHDFWLTRNWHGAGFWDGDWEDEAGKRLTDASHAYGECDLYIGDDGKVYII
jgi:hypothetical protein